MTPLRELNRHRQTLLFARKLLNFSILFQLPFLIEIALRQADLLLHLHVLGDRQMPGKLTAFLCVATSLLVIAGFTLVCRQLSLWEGNLEDSDLAQRTRLLGSMKIAASVQFFFYLTFLIPVFSLVPVLWARSKASTAIDDLNQLMPLRRR